MRGRSWRLADVFRDQANLFGAQPALTFSGETLTFAMLDRNANRVAQALLADGVEPGDRVATLTKNCSRFFEVLGGVAKVRACLAPINFRLAVAEIAFILADMAPRVLFVSGEMLAVAQEALARCEARPRIVVLDADEHDAASYERWRVRGADHDPQLQCDWDDDAFLLYTSGTTGQPKGVRLTQRNYAAMLDAFPRVPGFTYDNGETIANAMPLFHIAGINVAMAGLSQGCRVWPISEFVPTSLMKLIETARVNHAFLAPAMIARLLQAPEAATTDFSSLVTIAYGAAPIAADVLERARQRFACGFVQLYGMTESSGAGTYLDDAAHSIASKQGSCGVAWPGMQVRIVDASGRDVAAHEVGELLMRGDFVTPGYRNRAEATAAALRDGWLRTGDAAYRDEEGYIFIHDRMKDMIVTGGENVFPAEVENAIFGCPGVVDVAVIGIPSEKWGEEVKAIVVPAADAQIDEGRIIAWTKERIAAYKAPKSVDFVAALPRNAAGKILKRELRAPYWQGRARQVN
jgi:acyl-CoA synthetase (AMP-forming)/AMP-acid ligase II